MRPLHTLGALDHTPCLAGREESFGVVSGGQALSATTRSNLPNEVRPVGRGDDLEAAERNADAVVHLAGALQAIRGNPYQEANVGTVRRTIGAIRGSSVRRVVYLSYGGADPDSTNEYLATKERPSV
jgi:nucleoside-diphosphate-sugar epimerase